jgi:hypothetical protein
MLARSPRLVIVAREAKGLKYFAKLFDKMFVKLQDFFAISRKKIDLAIAENEARTGDL